MAALDSARAKLSRAEQHREAFDAARLEWVRSHLPRVERRWVNEYTETFSIHDLEEPPIGLAVLVGDFAHNVRSALDHLVFALWSEHAGVPDEESVRRVQMPIEATPERFEAIKGRTIGGLAPQARASVRALQPFNRPTHSLPAYPGLQDPAWHHTRHPLWLLKQLSNIDKHRVLPLTMVQQIGHMFDPPIPPAIGQVVSSSTGPLSEGQDVLRFAYSGPNPNAVVTPNILWDVGFGEQPDVGVEPRPLYPVKHHLADILRFAREEALPILEGHLGGPADPDDG